MKIRMLQTRSGAVDGVTVRTYQEGESYDLGPTGGAHDLGAVFVREGWAEEEREFVLTQDGPTTLPGELIADGSITGTILSRPDGENPLPQLDHDGDGRPGGSLPKPKRKR
jgi:hypothetical protein